MLSAAKYLVVKDRYEIHQSLRSLRMTGEAIVASGLGDLNWGGGPSRRKPGVPGHRPLHPTPNPLT